MRSVSEQTGVRKDSATNLARAFSYSYSQMTVQLERHLNCGMAGSKKTYEKLHLGYLFVYFLHELYNKINQLVLQHLLRMDIRDQE